MGERTEHEEDTILVIDLTDEPPAADQQRHWAPWMLVTLGVLLGAFAVIAVVTFVGGPGGEPVVDAIDPAGDAPADAAPPATADETDGSEPVGATETATTIGQPPEVVTDTEAMAEAIAAAEDAGALTPPAPESVEQPRDEAPADEAPPEEPVEEPAEEPQDDPVPPPAATTMTATLTWTNGADVGIDYTIDLFHPDSGQAVFGSPRDGEPCAEGARRSAADWADELTPGTYVAQIGGIGCDGEAAGTWQLTVTAGDTVVYQAQGEGPAQHPFTIS